MTDTIEAPPRAEPRVRPLQGSHVWYELMTPDSDGAAAFYQMVVPGWRVSPPIGGEQDYRIIGRSDGGSAGGILKLTSEMRSHGANPIWLGYLGADDVDATVAAIEARGGKALMPAFDIPQGRIAMVADPQGNPFYVMKPIPPEDKPEAQSDVFSPTEQQRIGWNELTTSDTAAARDFYGDLFGWKCDDFMPMGDMGDYRFFDQGSLRIGALCPVQPGGSAGWRYYIRVPSISQSVEAVKSSGGTIAMGPHEVPTGDHIVIGRDPQGAEFALVGKL